MLMKIKVPQLRLEIYVEKFESGWLSNRFWRGSSPLKKKEYLATGLGSGINHVWIETAKSLGLEEPGDAAKASVPQERGQNSPEGQLTAAAGVSKSDPEGSLGAWSAGEAGSSHEMPSPFADEMARVAKIVHRDNLAVRRMFADAKEAARSTLAGALIVRSKDIPTR